MNLKNEKRDYIPTKMIINVKNERKKLVQSPRFPTLEVLNKYGQITTRTREITNHFYIVLFIQMM